MKELASSVVNRALGVRLSEIRQIASEFVALTAKANLAFATEQATGLISGASLEDYIRAGHGDLSVESVIALRDTFLASSDTLQTLQHACLPVQSLEVRRSSF